MLDLMQSIRGRIYDLLNADGGQYFPAPGDRTTAIPEVYYRNYAPRQRDPGNLECIPGVVVYRITGELGFVQKTAGIGILWELYHPPYEGTEDKNYYHLGEENLDRADAMMVEVLKHGLSIGNWDLVNVIGVKYGAEGAQAENISAALYKITAKKTRG